MAERAQQPARTDRVGCVPVGHGCIQRALHVSLDGLAHLLTALLREPVGLLGEGADHLMALAAETAKLVTGEVRLRLTERFPEARQPLDLAGAAADEEVDDPG